MNKPSLILFALLLPLAVWAEAKEPARKIKYGLIPLTTL